MSYAADFVGHIDINPPLNETEDSYLRAFSASRRHVRPDGPYAVPGNPSAPETLSTDLTNLPAVGQPSLWCDWKPCWHGCCLSIDETSKNVATVEWLRYLVDHFLKPAGRAKTSGETWFSGFSFDHVLDGTVIGCRQDTRELFRIDVRDNKISSRVLRKGDDLDTWLSSSSDGGRTDGWHLRRQRGGDLSAPRPQCGVARGAEPQRYVDRLTG